MLEKDFYSSKEFNELTLLRRWKMTGTPGILMTIDHTTRFENSASLLHYTRLYPQTLIGFCLLFLFPFCAQL